MKFHIYSQNNKLQDIPVGFLSPAVGRDRVRWEVDIAPMDAAIPGELMARQILHLPIK